MDSSGTSNAAARRTEMPKRKKFSIALLWATIERPTHAGSVAGRGRYAHLRYKPTMGLSPFRMIMAIRYGIHIEAVKMPTTATI